MVKSIRYPIYLSAYDNNLKLILQTDDILLSNVQVCCNDLTYPENLHIELLITSSLIAIFS